MAERSSECEAEEEWECGGTGGRSWPARYSYSGLSTTTVTDALEVMAFVVSGGIMSS